MFISLPNEERYLAQEDMPQTAKMEQKSNVPVEGGRFHQHALSDETGSGGVIREVSIFASANGE